MTNIFDTTPSTTLLAREDTRDVSQSDFLSQSQQFYWQNDLAPISSIFYTGLTGRLGEWWEIFFGFCFTSR